jgi:hypothetical protein
MFNFFRKKKQQDFTYADVAETFNEKILFKIEEDKVTVRLGEEGNSIYFILTNQQFEEIVVAYLDFHDLNATEF